MKKSGSVHLPHRNRDRNDPSLTKNILCYKIVHDEKEPRKGYAYGKHSGTGPGPAERAEREKREKAGRLNCMLAERASAVVRMCCGIPSVLKGTLVLPADPEEGS